MSKIALTDTPEFRQMWADRVSSIEIATRYGTTYPTVNRFAKSIGLAARPRTGSKQVVKRDVSRANDELLLGWIADRINGKKASQIAADGDGSFNLQNVHNRTSDVLKDDVKFSGEPEARVRGAYW